MWTSHTPWSTPGRHRELVRALPIGAGPASEAARNVIGHYGTDFTNLRPPHRDEVNSRSLARILDADQARHPTPLDAPRDRETKVAGCCRDHALFVVGALREQGTAARTRVGFADYLEPDRRVDHVIVEYWNEGRWVRTDPEMVAGTVPFDPADMGTGPDGPFQTAAEAWRAARQGRVDLARYAIPPGSGFTDPNHLLRTYVALELAHHNRDELLLWDTWPGMRAFDDDALVDEIAERLVAGEADLASPYAAHGPGEYVTQLSPFGDPPRQVRIRPEEAV